MNNIMIKKAAMFGLDARIALAIFGALSVISGAALYSAIQNTKVVSLKTNINEVGKAAEAYMIDTLSTLPKSDFSHMYQTAYLVENLDSKPGWKGPYLPSNYKIVNETSTRNWLYNERTGTDKDYLFILEVYNSDRSANCTSGDCYVWIRYDIGDNISLVKKLDEDYDDGDKDTGNIMYFVSSGTVAGYTILYKYSAIPTSLL